jgi:hypothetical protein
MSRLRRGAFGFAALFALALQVLVVQTHVHTLAGGHPAPGFAQAANDPVAHALDVVGDAQQICIVALAGAGRMMLPGDAEIARLESFVLQQTALVIRFVAVGFSHSWRSRAPPIV